MTTPSTVASKPLLRPSYRIIQKRGVWYAQRRYLLRWRTIGPFGSKDGFADIQAAAFCASIYIKAALLQHKDEANG